MRARIQPAMGRLFRPHFAILILRRISGEFDKGIYTDNGLPNERLAHERANFGGA
jgi:hypothetical protein